MLNDVDGDGARDILLRGSGWKGETLPTWVLSGRTGRILSEGNAEAWSCGIWMTAASGRDADGDGWEDWITSPGDVAIVHSSRTGEVLDTFSRSNPDFEAWWRRAGDFDHDSCTDFMLRGTGSNANAVQIVSGKDGVLLARLVDSGLKDGPQSDVCIVSDQDGDGLSDFVVAHWSSNERKYVVRTISSATGTVIRRFEDVPGFRWSVRVQAAGDMNRDGMDDMLILSGESAVRLVSGCDGSTLFETRSTAGRPSGGPNEETGLGRAAASFVDSPGQGFVLVSLTEVNVVVGVVQCFSVADGKLHFVTAPPLEHDDWHFGSRIEIAGDLDGDGTPDFVTCPDHSMCGNPARVYICSGRTGQILWSAVRTLTGIDVD